MRVRCGDGIVVVGLSAYVEVGPSRGWSWVVCGILAK